MPAAAAAAAECLTLQGLPPCPEAAEVGQGRSYEPQALQPPVQQETEAQQPEARPTGSRDSRAEWARCLALASGSCGRGSSSSGGAVQPWRRRWLYVATNRGLVHRVQLPGGLLPGFSPSLIGGEVYT